MSTSSKGTTSSRRHAQLTGFPSRLSTSHTKRDLATLSDSHTRGGMNHTGAPPEAINKPPVAASGLDVIKLNIPRARTLSNIAVQSPQKLRKNAVPDKENVKIEEAPLRPMMGRSATSSALRKSPMPLIKSGPIKTDTLRQKSRPEALQAAQLSRISKSNLRVKAPMAAQQSTGLTKTRSAIALRRATTNIIDCSVNVQGIAIKQSSIKSGLHAASGKSHPSQKDTTVKSAAAECATPFITRSFKLRPSATSVFDTPFKSVTPETPWSPSILRTFFHASPSGPLEPLQLQGISESASVQTAMSALSPIKVCNEEESIGGFKHLRPVPSLGNVFYLGESERLTKEMASDRAKVAPDERDVEFADRASASGQSEHAISEDGENFPELTAKAGAQCECDAKLSDSEETPQTATKSCLSMESVSSSKATTLNSKHFCDTRPHDFDPANPTPAQSKSVGTTKINSKYPVTFLSRSGETRPIIPRTPPSTPTHRPASSASSRMQSALFPRLLTEFASKHAHLGFSSALGATPGSSSRKIHALDSQTARTQRELANLRAAAAASAAATTADKEGGEGKGSGRATVGIGRGSVLARARVFGETIWTGSTGTGRARVNGEAATSQAVEKVDSEAKKMEAAEVREPESIPTKAIGSMMKEDDGQSGCTDSTTASPASAFPPSIVSANDAPSCPSPVPTSTSTSTLASTPTGMKKRPAGKRVLGCVDSMRAVAMAQQLWKTRNFVLE